MTNPYDFSIDPVIQGLGNAKLKYLQGPLRDLIARRIEGIHYAETRRNQLATIGGALAPIGLALIPLGLGTQVIPLRVAYLCLGVGLLVLGAATWILYMQQTNYQYPWVNVASNWKWFYHGALPDEAAFGPDRWMRHSGAGRQAEERAATDQWTLFAAQAGGLAEERIDATQDLKQLYLLHINERYKNLFLTRMRQLLGWGLGCVVIVAVLGGVISLIASGPTLRNHTQNSNCDSTGLKSQANWSLTGAVRPAGLSSDDIEYQLDITIDNHRDNDVKSMRLVASDNSGKAIPAEFLMLGPPKEFIVKEDKISMSGHFWIASTDRNDLARICAE